MAYLLACSGPSDQTINVWAIPEPVLYGSLSNLPLKQGDREYTIEIKVARQRIERCTASPDLRPYFRGLLLSADELRLIDESRAVDEEVRQLRKDEHQAVEADTDDTPAENETTRLLSAVTSRLAEAGAFNPDGIVDARERVAASIVRRRGQPAFRKQLLAAYHGQCAITGCDVEAVLDAAHIMPYLGPQTNHPANGLLLRTDLHTLFDLGMVAIDVETMTVLVSPSLAGTSYEQLGGTPISMPLDTGCRPSPEALEQHRRENGL
jgi:hypothetical protein